MTTDDFLTNLPRIGPGYGLVRGQRREQRVWKLRHQDVHVKEGVHLHGCRCFIMLTRHTACCSLFILIKGDTEHVWRDFPKQRELLLWALWIFKMQPPSQLMTHKHAVMSTANMGWFPSTVHALILKKDFNSLIMCVYIYIYIYILYIVQLEATLGASSQKHFASSRMQSKKYVNSVSVTWWINGVISSVSTSVWTDADSDDCLDYIGNLASWAWCEFCIPLASLTGPHLCASVTIRKRLWVPN